MSNDGGSFTSDISRENLKLWLDYANSVFSTTGIKFILDSERDFSELHNTLINSIDSDEVSYNWKEQKSALDREAETYPNRLAIFFVYGDSVSGPRRSGFSWLHYNFIIMPGFNEAQKCGHQNISMLAHEIGHYLGLVHTFEETFTNKNTLLERIARYGVEYMDGDALSSTPPDPALYKDSERPMECYDAAVSNDTVSVGGKLYHVPRDNLMSYYDYPEKKLTGEQTEIILRNLRDYPRRSLISY
jgi:reprolysin-like metallo-peptidase family M12B